MLQTFALVDVKQDEFLEELDIVDLCDLMDSEATQWAKISSKVMQVGCSTFLRDGPLCKNKWHLVLPEYQCVMDCHVRTGMNSEDYWNLSAIEHVS